MTAAALQRIPEFPSPGMLLCSKYRLVRELGSGGMGTVWLARNEALGKDVAVKLLRSDAKTPDAAERFFREARAAASVDHPAIVRVFDYGETEAGQPFIVMERLEGESLADVIERHRTVPAIEAVRAILPIVDGLALAHEHGIVHRDLKPENVYLAVEGGHLTPKVLDFGVAKLAQADEDLHLTRQGMVVGSPVYMAPEQARGRLDVDLRCDVWAICVVLYEAVTGRTPFGGSNYNAVLRCIVEDDVPPFLEGVGEEGLWEILAIGLRKDRERRFQSMRELGEALAGYLLRHGVTDDVRRVALSECWQTAAAGAPSSGSAGWAESTSSGSFRRTVADRPGAQKRVTGAPSWRRSRWASWGAAALTLFALVAGAIGRYGAASAETDDAPTVAAAGFVAPPTEGQPTGSVSDTPRTESPERTVAPPRAPALTASTARAARSQVRAATRPPRARDTAPAKVPVPAARAAKPVPAAPRVATFPEAAPYDRPPAAIDLKDPY